MSGTRWKRIVRSKAFGLLGPGMVLVSFVGFVVMGFFNPLSWVYAATIAGLVFWLWWTDRKDRIACKRAIDKMRKN